MSGFMFWKGLRNRWLCSESWDLGAEKLRLSFAIDQIRGKGYRNEGSGGNKADRWRERNGFKRYSGGKIHRIL